MYYKVIGCYNGASVSCIVDSKEKAKEAIASYIETGSENTRLYKRETRADDWERVGFEYYIQPVVEFD